jgi:2-polyprenyl-6-methoxyphenol hydroxylase-like FAD-dependent oxidoreductase
LFTALLLAERDVPVQIVDEEFRTAAHSYALAMHPHSLQLLDEIGVAATLLRQGYRVDTVAFYDGADRCGEMKLSELDGDYPYVLVAPQSVLEGLLEQRLRNKGVRVQWNHRVRKLEAKEAKAAATIDKMVKAPCGYAVATTEWVIEKTLHTEAAFAVGADGHRSIVRKTLGIEYGAAGFSDSFAVFEFHSDVDLKNEVRIVFDGETTNVLWPLPGNRCRWSFQLERKEASAESRLKHRLTVPIGRQAFPHLTRDDLNTLIRERAPWLEAEVQRMDWSMEVRFDRRLVDRYGRHRCWLAGDAAHLTGPVGGQSVNMGLREAHDLAGKAIGILREGAPLESLEDYSTRHLAQWRQLLGIDGGLAPSDGAQPWAKQHCSRILPCIPATGDDLANLAAQVGLHTKPAGESS